MMEFWVNLIEVVETKCQEAREDLYANCTHVSKGYWLFEGDIEVLHDGIEFNVVGCEAIEGTGDLTGSQIKAMVCDVYGVERSFIY